MIPRLMTSCPLIPGHGRGRGVGIGRWKGGRSQEMGYDTNKKGPHATPDQDRGIGILRFHDLQHTGEVISPKVKGSCRVASEFVNIRAIGTCSHLAVWRIKRQRWYTWSNTEFIYMFSIFNPFSVINISTAFPTSPSSNYKYFFYLLCI